MIKTAGITVGTAVALTWGPVLAMIAAMAVYVVLSTVRAWREVPA